MGVLPEPKWEFRNGMWVKAIWKPGPPIKEQDALYRKRFWEGQNETKQANSRESAETAGERAPAQGSGEVKG